MSKTKEIHIGKSRKVTEKQANGGYESREINIGKTIELEEGDVEDYEVQRLSKELDETITRELQKE